MPPEEPKATFRVRRFQRSGQRPRPYHESHEVSDEASGRVLATCDLAGKAVVTTLEITDDVHQRWQVTPNRKVLPTRWTLTDGTGAVHQQFDLRLAGKLLNPVQRTSLALLDAAGNEVARLMDGRDGVAERMFGAVLDEWILVRDEELLAQFATLPKRGPPRSGLRSRLAGLFAGGDRGIRVESANYALSAPALLALLALHDELTTPV